MLVAYNHEYPANPGVDAEPLIPSVRRRLRAGHPPRRRVGSLNADAVRLMDEAGFG